MADTKITLSLEDKVSAVAKRIADTIKGVSKATDSIDSSSVDRLSKELSTLASQSSNGAAAAAKLASSVSSINDKAISSLAPAIKQVSREASGAAATLQKLVNEVNKSSNPKRRFEELADSIRSAETRTRTASKAMGKLTSDIQRVGAGKGLTQLTKQASSLSKGLSTTLNSTSRLRTQMSGLTTATASTGTAMRNTASATNAYSKATDKAERSSNRATVALSKQGAQLRTLVNVSRGAAAVFATAFAARQGAAGIGSLVKTASEVKTLELRINTLSQEFENNSDRFSQIVDIANKAGVEVGTLSEVYNRAAIASKSLGANSESISLFLSNVAKAGVASGASAVNLKSGLIQLSQALSAGTVRAEEFNSILENVPIIATVASKALGTTTAALRQQVLAGTLASKDLFEAIQNSTDDIDKLFAPLSGSINAQLSRLNNTFRIFVKDTVESSGLLDAASDGIQSLIDSIENGDLDFSGLSQQIGQMITQLANDLPSILQGITSIAEVAGKAAQVFQILVSNIDSVIVVLEILIARSIATSAGVKALGVSIAQAGSLAGAATTLFTGLAAAVARLLVPITALVVAFELTKAAYEALSGELDDVTSVSGLTEEVEKLDRTLDKLASKEVKIQVDFDGNTDLIAVRSEIERLGKTIDALNKKRIARLQIPVDERVNNIADTLEKTNNAGLSRDQLLIQAKALDTVQTQKDANSLLTAQSLLIKRITQQEQQLGRDRGAALENLRQQQSVLERSLANGVVKRGSQQEGELQQGLAEARQEVFNLTQQIGKSIQDAFKAGVAEDIGKLNLKLAVTQQRFRELAKENDNGVLTIDQDGKQRAAIDEIQKKLLELEKLRNRGVDTQAEEQRRQSLQAELVQLKQNGTLKQQLVKEQELAIQEERIKALKAFANEATDIEGTLVKQGTAARLKAARKNNKQELALRKKNITERKKLLTNQLTAVKSELNAEKQALQKSLREQEKLVKDSQRKIKDLRSEKETAQEFLDTQDPSKAARRLATTASNTQRETFKLKRDPAATQDQINDSLKAQVTAAGKASDAIQGEIDRVEQLRDAFLAASEAASEQGDRRNARKNEKEARKAQAEINDLASRKRRIDKQGTRAAEEQLAVNKKLTEEAKANEKAAKSRITDLKPQLEDVSQLLDHIRSRQNEIKGVVEGEVDIKGVDAVLDKLTRIAELQKVISNPNLNTAQKLEQTIPDPTQGEALTPATLNPNQKKDTNGNEVISGLDALDFEAVDVESKADTSAAKDTGREIATTVQNTLNGNPAEVETDADTQPAKAEVAALKSEIDNTVATMTVRTQLANGVSAGGVPTDPNAAAASKTAAGKTGSFQVSNNANSSGDPKTSTRVFSSGGNSFGDSAGSADKAAKSRARSASNVSKTLGTVDDTEFKFNAGGLVQGTGGGTNDSVKARVAPGEFIMRESAVRSFGTDFMNSVNQGRPTTGSLVGSDRTSGASNLSPTTINIPGMPPVTGQFDQDSIAVLKSAVKKQAMKSGRRR